MVFHARGRGRTHFTPFRGRGKPFRGRGRGGNKGQGLLITLNSRDEGRDDRHGRDDRSFGDGHDYGSLGLEEKRKQSDDFHEWRGESPFAARNRSHDKSDLPADAESLRITVGNERFHKDREDISPKRSTPLAERLGPPVDDPGSRYRKERDTYPDDRVHGHDRHESGSYSRQEKGSVDNYMDKRGDRHDYRQYDRPGRRAGSDDRDWKNRDSVSDHRAREDYDHKPREEYDHKPREEYDHRSREDYRFRQQEDRHRDDGHRSREQSRERYNRDDSRHKDRRHDRLSEDISKDGKFKKDFTQRRDRNNDAKSRSSSRDRYEREKYRGDVDPKSRHSTERSHENWSRNDQKSESDRYSSSERYNSSKRSEFETVSPDCYDEEKITEYPPSYNEPLDASSTSVQSAPKPLKSILKKRSDAPVGQHEDQSGLESQVSDFLKRLQSPVNLSRMEKNSQSSFLPSKSSFETVTDVKDRQFAQGHKPDVTAGGYNEMDVDDEEEFLYGGSSTSGQRSLLQVSQHKQDCLFPVVKGGGQRPKSSPEKDSQAEVSERKSDTPTVSSANLPSWMRPLSPQDEGKKEKKDENMDKTVQNILKSIGFNFDLSKRMQELAKIKKQKEEESQFSINKNASFLGAGISSADLKAKLFSKEDKTTSRENVKREIKEQSKQSMKKSTGREADGRHTSDDRSQIRPWLKQSMSQASTNLADDADSVYTSNTSSKYTPHQISASFPVSHDAPTASHFPPVPTHFTPPYSAPYQVPYSHALPKEHLHVPPPGIPHPHIHPLHGYSPSYFHPDYPPDPHTVQPDAARMHTIPHSKQPVQKAKRTLGSSNLTIIPLAGNEKKKTEKVADHTSAEKNSQPTKRARDKSPEYSRIVIAPKAKAKEKQESSPARKALKRPPEKNDKEERVPFKQNKKNTDKLVKPEQTESKGKTEDKKPLPISAKEQHLLLKESEERKKKMVLLEKELGKLKKHQNEIMRRRQRQRDGHKDPLLVQNSKLQEEITAQIKILRKASEKSDSVLRANGKKAGITNTSTIVKEEACKEEVAKPSSGSGKRHEFYDPGNHWCGVCNHVTSSLLEHLGHLQSRKHKQKCDPYDRPWMKVLENKSKMGKEDAVTISPMKGVEFMMSTDAFYCTLCHVFTGDVSCAEAHIKSEEHYVKYESHIKQNEFYEKRYTLEKTAALSQVKDETEPKKGSNLIGKKEIEAASKTSMEMREREDKNVDETTTRTKKQTAQMKRQKDNSGVRLKNEKDSPDDKLTRVAKRQKLEPLQRNRNSQDDSESLEITDGDNMEDEKSTNVSRKREGDELKEDPKQEEMVKGKIAIKLTGKTGIKPQAKVLPPWTPVTKRLDFLKSKPKAESVSLKKGIYKAESESPSSLDTFLTISGPTTKKLPVYKLRTGTVKKSLNPKTTSQEQSKKQADGKETGSEELEDMKLLGIETDMATQIAPKKTPPPRSQNMSLPKETSSQSSSSAKELYSVFFQDVADGNGEKSAQDINLEDIPIPPPPPQPPVPKAEALSEIPLPATCSESTSSRSKSSDTVMITESSLNIDACTSDGTKSMETIANEGEGFNVEDTSGKYAQESSTSDCHSKANSDDAAGEELTNQKALDASDQGSNEPNDSIEQVVVECEKETSEDDVTNEIAEVNIAVELNQDELRAIVSPSIATKIADVDMDSSSNMPCTTYNLQHIPEFTTDEKCESAECINSSVVSNRDTSDMITAGKSDSLIANVEVGNSLIEAEDDRIGETEDGSDTSDMITSDKTENVEVGNSLAETNDGRTSETEDGADTSDMITSDKTDSPVENVKVEHSLTEAKDDRTGETEDGADTSDMITSDKTDSPVENVEVEHSLAEAKDDRTGETEDGADTSDMVTSDKTDSKLDNVEVGSGLTEAKDDRTVDTEDGTDTSDMFTSDKTVSPVETVDVGNSLTEAEDDRIGETGDSVDLNTETGVNIINTDISVEESTSRENCMDTEESESVPETYTSHIDDIPVAETEDCSSPGSASSVHMDSDFEVVDEYEAD